jgi:hypothetical protein
LEDLWVLDGLEDGRILSEKVNSRKGIIDLERITLLEELSWRQKSMALWLKEDEKCTKFFHQVANLIRTNNSIEQWVANGTIFPDQSKIREHIVQFYDNFLWSLIPDQVIIHMTISYNKIGKKMKNSSAETQ